MFPKINSLNDKQILSSCQGNEAIFLVCAADDKYAMPLTVMIRSVLENLKYQSNIIVFIVDGGIKKYRKEKILKSLNFANCEIKFVAKPDSSLFKDIEEVNKYCEEEGITIHKNAISIATYYRLLLPELLPESVDKVIYLDCDLVVEEDLMHLWNLDLKENYLLAAPDLWIRSVSAHNGLLNYEELQIASDAKYFNAGVLVVNLKKWRTDKIMVKAIEYLKKNKSYIRFHDQDVLNALLAGQWGEIDPRWNHTPGIYEYASWGDSPFSEHVYKNLIQHPYIIHFAASIKPWNCRDMHFKEHFFYYVDKTEWSGWRFTFWKQIQLRVAHKLQKFKSRFINS